MMDETKKNLMEERKISLSLYRPAFQPLGTGAHLSEGENLGGTHYGIPHVFSCVNMKRTQGSGI